MVESKWSHLPEDILMTIAKRLNTRVDNLRFRSVCRIWRSCAPVFISKPFCPLNLPLPGNENFDLHKNPHVQFYLSQSLIYLMLPPQESSSGAPHGPWLFRAEELSNGKYRPLAPLSRLLGRVPEGFPKVLNLLDFPVFEICRAFSLDFVRTTWKAKSRYTKKAVLSTSPFTPGGDDFEIVAIDSDSKLMFIRNGDEKWRFIHDFEDCKDVVYHKGKFYAVDRKGMTVFIGPDFKAVQVASPIVSSEGQYKRLVTFGKDLYLFDKIRQAAETPVTYNDNHCKPPVLIDMEHYVRIYKLHEEEKRWVQVCSLADKLFFVGGDCSYAVSAQDFGGLLKPVANCVYFWDMFSTKNGNPEGLFRHMGVYDLNDHTCRPLAYLDSHSKLLWPAPTRLNPE